MAKGRMLNRSISVSAKFQALPDDTCRLMATWMIPQLDTNGVFHAEPAIVKSFVLPLRPDVSAEQVREYLQAMQRVGLIVLFVAKGQMWQVWPGFNDNQPYLRKNREGKSDFPIPPADLTQVENPLPDSLPIHSGVNRGNGKEEKGREENITFPLPPVADVTEDIRIATEEAMGCEAVRTWRRKVRRPITAEAINYIFQNVTDIDRWSDVLDYWLINNHNPENIMGQVSMYTGWETDKRNPKRGQHSSTASGQTSTPQVEWVTTPKGKVLRYEGQPYPGDAGRQKCEELGIAYEGN